MQQSTDKFYNMYISLIKNGRIYKEQVAIRNIWQKGNNIFLDIYFHRLQKSFVFDAAFVKDIYDINCDRVYQDINQFISAFSSSTPDIQSSDTKAIKKDKEDGILSPFKDDIALLLFMSYLWKDKNIIKDRIIIDYIKSNLPSAQNLSERYLKSYISTLHPSVTDFYDILSRLKSKRPKAAEQLLQEAIKICLSDGYLHYNERMYLADIIQALREYGLKLQLTIP